MSRGITETLPLLNLSENGPAKMTTSTKTAPKTAASTLRKPQVRLILALTAPMNRGDWATSGGVNETTATAYVGSLNPETREVNDERYWVSLLTLKLVKVKMEDEEGKNVAYYDLTAKGKKLQARLIKEELEG